MRSIVLLAVAMLVGCAGGSSDKNASNGFGGRDGGGSDGGHDSGQTGGSGFGVDASTDKPASDSRSDTATGGLAGSVGSGPLLLLPPIDNQAPIKVGMEHAGFVFDLPGLLHDSQGNIYMFSAKSGQLTTVFSLTKYSSSLSLVWSMALDNYGALRIGPDGSIYYGKKSTGGYALAKMNSDRTPAWSNQSFSVVDSIAFTADGSVIVAGNPVEANPMPWIARYAADGTQTWFKQYAPDLSARYEGKQLFIDDSEKIILTSFSHLLRADSLDGREISRVTNLAAYGSMVMTPAKDAFYSRGVSSIVKYDLNGAVTWSREETQLRSVVLDPQTKVMWIGKDDTMVFQSASDPAPLVTEDSIYLTGIFLNYVDSGGSTTPPALFVGRYSLTGARMWFQEYLLGEDTGRPFPNGIVLDPTGNPIVAARDSSTGRFIFKVNAADGSLL